MEVGKLKTSGASPIFYFIIDPIAPDDPNPSRLQHFFVISHLDSYVEAFNFLTRTLCVPPTDGTLRRWHAVYSKVFGAVTFDAFCRAVQTLPVRHFHLERSEAAARAYVSSAAERSGSASRRVGGGGESRGLSPHRTRTGPGLIPEQTMPATGLATHRETGLLVYPQRDVEDAALELHRLRAELVETQGHLRTEQSKGKVNGLGDAERTALLYKLESAQKELEAEKLRSKESSDKLRSQISALQVRMDKLLEQHDDHLNHLAAAEKQHLKNVEESYQKREFEMKEEFENAVRERDRRLQKASLRADTAEQQLHQVLRELELQREENARLTGTTVQLKTEREHEEQQYKRLKLQFEALETHRINLERDLVRWEQETRRAEGEIGRLRADAARWKREAERMHHFTSSLQTELRDLDAESATTAELLRRKVLRERHTGGAAALASA